MQNIMQRSPHLRRTPKADGASPPACWWLQQPRSPWSCTLEASCRCSAEAADGAWVEADEEEAAQGAASVVVGAAEAARGAAWVEADEEEAAQGAAWVVVGAAEAAQGAAWVEADEAEAAQGAAWVVVGAAEA